VTVRIVTDSLSDLSSDLVGNLDITVVPLTVLFGHETYLDRVTISTDEFYHRLVHGDIWPASTQPSSLPNSAVPFNQPWQEKA
jgi:fatty acid-binding protein DegV